MLLEGLLEAPGGSWRLLAAPGSSWALLEVSGNSRLIHQTPQGHKSSRQASGGFRRLLEASGGFWDGSEAKIIEIPLFFYAKPASEGTSMKDFRSPEVFRE